MKKTLIQTFKIILNTPIRKDILLQSWSITDILICADGGLNRLYNLFKDNKQRKQYTPNFVIGDLDSVDKDILKFYS